MVRDDVVAGLTGRGIVRTQDARAAGVDPRDLRKAHAGARLVRVRPDAYVAAAEWTRLSETERYRLRVAAASGALYEPVFSRFSAAVVLGLPLIGRWPTAVHVVGPASGGGRSWPGVVRHGTVLEVRVQEHEGLFVTDPATTVVDMARVVDFASALAMADHALREGLASAEELAEAADMLGSRRGSRAARRVAERADPRSESPGESLSRARMIELGVRVPELQHEVSDARGLVGRTDFYWPELRLVGEFDGRLKYRTGGVTAGPAAEERVWEEEVREDRLRATGLGVTRWTWHTAWSVRLFADHLRSAGIL